MKKKKSKVVKEVKKVFDNVIGDSYPISQETYTVHDKENNEDVFLIGWFPGDTWGIFPFKDNMICPEVFRAADYNYLPCADNEDGESPEYSTEEIMKFIGIIEAMFPKLEIIHSKS